MLYGVSVPHSCINNMARYRYYLVILTNIVAIALILDIPPGVFIRLRQDYAGQVRLRSSSYDGTRRMVSFLPCCLPFGKPGELQILRY